MPIRAGAIIGPSGIVAVRRVGPAQLPAPGPRRRGRATPPRPRRGECSAPGHRRRIPRTRTTAHRRRGADRRL